MVWGGRLLNGSMRLFGNGDDYEFAVLRDGRPYYDSGVTSDVVRGNWSMMEKLKCMVTDLNPDHLSS